MTIETRLAEIRARVEAATEGPWMVDPEDFGTILASNDGGFDGYHIADVHDHDGGMFPVEHNGQFIAASRTDLPDLLAAVEAVMGRLPSLLEAAWDDGNALGLDGWTGPERGEEPDEHAIRRRARLRSKLVDEAYEALTDALEVQGNE